MPIYFRKEKIKEKRAGRMCKFFAHHMTCRAEEKGDDCEFLHDETVRYVHDLLDDKKGDKKQISSRQIQSKLVFKYNEKNHKHRTELLWKQEALNFYPERPSY